MRISRMTVEYETMKEMFEHQRVLKNDHMMYECCSYEENIFGVFMWVCSYRNNSPISNKLKGESENE